MSELFAFDVNGRRVACTAILVECVQDQLIPNDNGLSDWDSLHAFFVQRAQKALGKWPVHVMRQTYTTAVATRFTGFRVYAKCCSFRPDEPDVVEYGILVWHQNEINVTAKPPESDDVNWSDFAEPMDV